MLIVDLSPSLRAHVGIAVRDRVRQLRRDGMPVPAELADLADALLRPGAARSGQERPEMAEMARVGEGGSADGSAPPLYLLPAPGAARRLGISERSLRRRAAAGQIARTRIGGRVLYRAADVDALAERSRRGAEMDAAGTGGIPG